MSFGKGGRRYKFHLLGLRGLTLLQRVFVMRPFSSVLRNMSNGLMRRGDE